MLILYTTATSPYGRKVRMAALRVGLYDRMERRGITVGDPNDPILTANPLGKIPCLVLEDGQAIFDSPVIMEYLDHVSGGALIPRDPIARIGALRQQALGDGLMDASVAMSVERLFRPAEQVSERWLALHRGKVERTLAAFAAQPPSPKSEFLGSCTLAAALGYLDWRQPVPWREQYAPLVEWLDTFRHYNPEYDATAS